MMRDQTREIKLTPPHKSSKSNWYLLTGLVLGLAAGLIFTWVIFPIVYEDTSPVTLAEGYKEIYRRIIAEVYTATGDLDRASSRLNLLEDDDPISALGAQAQRALADGREKEARALALLASSIQSGQSNRESIPLLIKPTTVPAEPGVFTQTLPQLVPKP